MSMILRTKRACQSMSSSKCREVRPRAILKHTVTSTSKVVSSSTKAVRAQHNPAEIKQISREHTAVPGLHVSSSIAITINKRVHEIISVLQAQMLSIPLHKFPSQVRRCPGITCRSCADINQTQLVSRNSKKQVTAPSFNIPWYRLKLHHSASDI